MPPVRDGKLGLRIHDAKSYFCKTENTAHDGQLGYVLHHANFRGTTTGSPRHVTSPVMEATKQPPALSCYKTHFNFVLREVELLQLVEVPEGVCVQCVERVVGKSDGVKLRETVERVRGQRL